MKRVIEGFVGKVKKIQGWEVGTLYCAGFLSQGINETFPEKGRHGMVEGWEAWGEPVVAERQQGSWNGSLLCGCKDILTEGILCRSPPSFLQYIFHDTHLPDYMRQQWHSCLLSCPAVSHDYSWGHSPCPKESPKAWLLASVQLHKELFAISEPISCFIPKIQYLSSAHTVGKGEDISNPYITWE